MRWKLVAGIVLVASRVFAQPALYPGANQNFISGRGTAPAIAKFTNTGVVSSGSLADSATQANKSVCFADGNPPLPVLNCGDSGIKYTKGTTPTLNLGVNGQYQINGINVLGGTNFTLAEGAAPSGVPGYDILWADSTAHRLKMNNNNAGADVVVGAATTDTFTNKSISASQINSGAFTLAGARFANNGTTTTVLHGNAAGNPSFAAVSLTADVTGVLPNANTTAASANTASAIVTRDGSGNFAAGTITAALSGNATTASSLAANQGTTTTVLHGNAAGTPSFSAVVLTTDVSGVLPTANGGTGQNSTATFPASGTVAVRITGTAAETPGSINASECADQASTITVTGAVAGDSCEVGTPAAGPGTHIVASCYVSGADTATVRLCNVNTGPQTGTTGTYRATVVR